MPGIYSILNVASRALLAQERAIDITGHNIANVNTPGYSRQRVNMETGIPIPYGPGMIGTGVRATEIQRIHDRFLGMQINIENQNLSKWEAEKGALERSEIIFDESSGYGLNQAMSDYWATWQDLANNPSGHTERVGLLAAGEILTTTFNDLYAQLEQLQKDLDVSITGTVDQINIITEQIADLNQKIAQSEVNHENANDYRDQRDLLLEELSSMIDINSFEDDQGRVTVLAGGGTPLVQSNSSWDLSTQVNGEFHDVVWTDSDGNTVDITQDISGGNLAGWLEARDTTIPGYMARLDTLAGEMIAQVNALHQGGFALDGSTARNFFTGSSASDITVNADIMNDPDLIAASATLAGVPGDNSNAVAIANLQNQLTVGGTATFDEYYNALVSDVGRAVQTAAYNVEHQNIMKSHMENYRESVSGVSLDEEMVNLVKYEHAYQAAAKLITAMDDLLNTVINMV
ncbi:MAG: flagellar hook-associated protein FlgK [Desulfatiglans sp.]|jgi:flagellar hook-associated protein 1 FlgK|nr:flagellar hook-associated protein FlgK [Desulfatiglans sp.]